MSGRATRSRWSLAAKKGKIGSVLRVLPAKRMLIVENLNKVKRHQKGRGAQRQSGVVEKEAPIHCANVMVMCGKCVKPVRLRKRVLEDGKKVRICAKCNDILDT